MARFDIMTKDHDDKVLGRSGLSQCHLLHCTMALQKVVSGSEVKEKLHTVNRSCWLNLAPGTSASITFAACGPQGRSSKQNDSKIGSETNHVRQHSNAWYRGRAFMQHFKEESYVVCTEGIGWLGGAAWQRGEHLWSTPANSIKFWTQRSFDSRRDGSLHYGKEIQCLRWVWQQPTPHEALRRSILLPQPFSRSIQVPYVSRYCNSLSQVSLELWPSNSASSKPVGKGPSN